MTRVTADDIMNLWTSVHVNILSYITYEFLTFLHQFHPNCQTEIIMSNQGGFVQAVKSYRFWILPSIDDCVDGAFNTKKNFDSTLEKVKTTYETTVENVKSTYENTIDTVKSTNESVQERVKANYDQGIFEGTKQTGMDLAHHGYNLSLFIMSLRIWQTKTVQDWFKTFFIFSK